MKKVKVCDHCDKKFKNRESLRNHLASFHEMDLMSVRHKVKQPNEGKPQRRIRMIAHMARLKKERDFVSRKAMKHGIQ